MKTLVVDHHDSFVFNLVDDLHRLGGRCEVLRSTIGVADLLDRDPDLVVLSPGPGTPADAGVMLPLLAARPELPIIGVCLGMQAMVEALGGRVEELPSAVHGSSGRIRHFGDPAFESISSTFRGARYHSLGVGRCPPELQVVARLEDRPQGLPMAVRHRSLPWVGFQFHPESVLTAVGPRILANTIRSLLS